MREFKPMVKMETTEPTVELKLKKGGAVKKMADGGMPMGAMIGAPKGGMMAGAKPKKPSLAARRRAMMASGAAGAPAGRAESMMSAMPAMKKGGRVKGGEMESPKVHKAEMKELSGIKKELTKHEGMPASKGHRGLKTGGVVNGQGGFRKGGAAKKFAEGGRVQHDGGPEQMPQGKKKPAGPVSINQLSGTYKKGGAVMMAVGGSTQNATNAAAQRAEMRKNAAISAQVAAQKAATDRANVQKAAAERAKVAAAINPSVNVSQQRSDQIKASYAAAVKASQSRAAASRAAAVAEPQIAGLDPKTGRFAPGSMEYMAPQVIPSLPKSAPSAMPKPMPMPVPSDKYDRPTVPSEDLGARPMPLPAPRTESSDYRRGGKVQNNGKKRGGAVC
jgi:hypothetical protein